MHTCRWLDSSCCDLSLLTVPAHQLHCVSQAKGDYLPKQAPDDHLQVATVLVISLGVAGLVFLARPVIDNTVASFPTRSASPPESPSESFIPGLEPE